MMDGGGGGASRAYNDIIILHTTRAILSSGREGGTRDVRYLGRVFVYYYVRD